MGFPYLVSNIQATEPEALPKAQGIRVTVEPEHDSMGFNTVTIEATSREVLLAYVREHWGSGDEEWLEEWVDRRIEFAAGELETELMLCLDGAEEISLGLRDGDDAFNSEQERSAFDRAYELKESNPDSVVSIVIARTLKPYDSDEEVTLRMSRGDAFAIAEALDLLADVDEGEHTDYEDLRRLALDVKAGAN